MTVFHRPSHILNMATLTAMIDPPPQPLNVALISFAVQSPGGQEAVRLFTECGLQGCTLIGITRALRLSGPEKLAIEMRSGAMVPVQRIVLSHANFVSILTSCIDDTAGTASGRLRVHLRVDAEGVISDAVCRAKQEQLNSMVVDDGDGPIPTFSCKHWPLARVPVDRIEENSARL